MTKDKYVFLLMINALSTSQFNLCDKKCKCKIQVEIIEVKKRQPNTEFLLIDDQRFAHKSVACATGGDKSETLFPEHKMQSTKHKIRNTKYKQKMQDTKYNVEIIELKKKTRHTTSWVHKRDTKQQK